MQHPDFDEFKRSYRAGEYAQALSFIDRLMSSFPQSAALFWHRVNCLEKLERYAEVPPALDGVLQRMPDYAAALMKRVDYTDWYLDQQAPLHGDDEDDLGDESVSTAVANARTARAAAQLNLEHRNIADLRKLLNRTDASGAAEGKTALSNSEIAQANFLLANVLRNRESGDVGQHELEEARDLLNKAITLCPAQIDYRLARADDARRLAWVDVQDDVARLDTDSALVRTYSGIYFKRAELEAAVVDYRYCWEQAKVPGHAMKLATILHDLGRYDEALQVYDQVLTQMPIDAPHREYFIEKRKLSENSGAGEREHMAQLLLNSLDDDGKDRSLHDSMAAQAMVGAAEAIRHGASVSDALAAHISDDPDTMQAMNIARQILSVAHEAKPELVAVDASDYPRYQQKHCQRAEKAAQAIGLIKIADAEAMGLFTMLGQHVMLRFFRDDSGELGLASFTMKPKWPGLIGFLLMFLSGKWKQHRMIECVTTFDDGGMITTQPHSISPFEYGGKIIQNKLPAKASLADLVTAHRGSVASYLQQNPSVKSVRVTDLAGVEARWIAGQEAKAAYRESINYVSDAELQIMLGSHYERFADKVREQLRLMTVYS
ncbi:hypothetical protein H8K52_04795 [Undibacterium seohonense]|uniref:Tetratricopeptide repeat protein n=1 Tax=Undibacterium seohonense TaxID=1344950 RepID=A0ABR6X180_9BURK|nr:hypothetical protein [Undibacterium seohonense]MBC3806662.1 hypothetical protein [Undibacterium seohonense]